MGGGSSKDVCTGEPEGPDRKRLGGPSNTSYGDDDDDDDNNNNNNNRVVKKKKVTEDPLKNKDPAKLLVVTVLSDQLKEKQGGQLVQRKLTEDEQIFRFSDEMTDDEKKEKIRKMCQVANKVRLMDVNAEIVVHMDLGWECKLLIDTTSLEYIKKVPGLGLAGLVILFSAPGRDGVNKLVKSGGQDVVYTDKYGDEDPVFQDDLLARVVIPKINGIARQLGFKYVQTHYGYNDLQHFRQVSTSGSDYHQESRFNFTPPYNNTQLVRINPPRDAEIYWGLTPAKMGWYIQHVGTGDRKYKGISHEYHK